MWVIFNEVVAESTRIFQVVWFVLCHEYGKLYVVVMAAMKLNAKIVNNKAIKFFILQKTP